MIQDNLVIVVDTSNYKATYSEDVPFKASSGSISVTPGTYTISVTVANTKDVAIGPLEVTLDAAGIYGVAAVDNVGGGAPFSVILLDDFIVM